MAYLGFLWGFKSHTQYAKVHNMMVVMCKVIYAYVSLKPSLVYAFVHVTPHAISIFGNFGAKLPIFEMANEIL